jgi:hypothetical protein
MNWTQYAEPEPATKPGASEPICLKCHQPFKANPHWLCGGWHFARVCQGCDAPAEAPKPKKRGLEIPDRYRDFDNRLIRPELRNLYAHWTSKGRLLHALLIGPAGRGKSRAAWHLIEYLNRYSHNAPTVEDFEELLIEMNAARVNDLVKPPWLFIDNVGAVTSYGYTRSLIQSAIRIRLKRGKATFMTIDDPGFDRALPRLIEGSGLTVTLK